MARLHFDQLVAIYRNVRFAPDEPEGELTIASADILAALELLQQDPAAAEDANLEVQVDALPGVGGVVPVYAGPPRIGTGLLVRTLDDLLRSREARLHEPDRYFIIEGAVDDASVPPTPLVAAYRKVLALVALFVDCAAYVDPVRQEIVFFTDRKVVVPINYDAGALAAVATSAIDTLIGHFADTVHKDQKLAILAEAVIATVEPHPLTDRFVHLLRNVETLNEAVRNGYALFASTFSYARIRGEVEAAKVDYVAKIHKTLIDIQGQLLGIPIATVIVASQMKASTGCDAELWTNRAVLGGVWIFVVLLAMAIVNQWLTLASIDEDITAQRKRLETEYAAIGKRFSDVFETLSRRIRWHYGVLVAVAVIALTGAAFATATYNRLTEQPNGACATTIVSPAPTVAPAKPADEDVLSVPPAVPRRPTPPTPPKATAFSPQP